MTIINSYGVARNPNSTTFAASESDGAGQNGRFLRFGRHSSAATLRRCPLERNPAKSIKPTPPRSACERRRISSVARAI